jgi:1-acyl-sn-glycerol-3-phosphate acyltransferase
MLRVLLSTVFWIFLGLSSIALFPIALLIWLVTAPFDPRRAILHRFTCFWASLYTWLNPAWPVHIEGRERVRRGVTYVMVANHQSFLDILVLFRLFVHFKWVSKIEIFSVPLIGWNMSLNRYIRLRRGDRESIREMMTASEAALAGGSSIMMFPEGTRSADGRLKPFKSGAFVLAKRMNLPLLPIVVRGTSQALPKRGFVLRGRHHIRIEVRGEIPPESFADISAEELTLRMQRYFATELGEVEAQAVVVGSSATGAARGRLSSPISARARPHCGRGSRRGGRSRGPSPA